MASIDTYTDDKGNMYELHAESDPTGDIILTTQDDMAFRTHSYFLKAHSPVLRVMLQSLTSEPVIHLPEIASAALATVLRVFDQKPLAHSARFDDRMQAIQFCIKYECNSAARSILRTLPSKVSESNLFDAFALASTLGVTQVAADILRRGHLAYFTSTGTPSPVRSGKGGARPIKAIQPRKRLCVSDQSFGVNEARRIPIEWLLALSQAEMEVMKGDDLLSSSKPEYWEKIAQGFTKRLA